MMTQLYNFIGIDANFKTITSHETAVFRVAKMIARVRYLTIDLTPLCLQHTRF